MEYYYYAKSKFDKWVNSIPTIPENIGEIPVVAIGAVAVTCITLAAVTLTDRSIPDNMTNDGNRYMPSSNSGPSNFMDNIKKSIAPSSSYGGKKQKHHKTKHNHKTEKNKTR